MNVADRTESAKGRDIGPLKEPVNPKRRAGCALDLRKFLDTYHAEAFPLPFSADHIRVIEGIQRAALEGGLQAIGMPRGFGKTTICEKGAEWALLYGHRRFVMLIGAEMESAVEMLTTIRTDLETNDMLVADFPDVCQPIAALEGINQRAAGQLIDGERTYIAWTGKMLRLPMVKVAGWAKRKPLKGFVGKGGWSLAAGGIVKVAGILGRIRGTKAARADGTNVRPDLALIDDPQTDESAGSPDQCDKRERTMTGAVLGLAGPGKSIAALSTVTVIRKDDMADRLLDRAKHPEWHGEKSRMVLSFPTNREMWDQYAELRRAAMRDGAIECVAANEFYATHRELMDAGGAVSWPDRKLPTEASGIQHAMNLLIDRGERVFMAEYQLDPIPEASDSADVVSVDWLMSKTNGIARAVVPVQGITLTLFVDVQKTVLLWKAVAWENGFGGSIVDYGEEPDQGVPYWNLGSVKRTLQHAAPGAGLEGSIYMGLERLTDRLLGREWKRDDGTVMRVARQGIDSGWGPSTSTVYKFCRESRHAALLVPTKGYGVGPAGKPMAEWPRRPGERHGDNWIERPATTGKRTIKHLLYDTNHWKTFVMNRLAAAKGDPGSVSLFGKSGDVHRMVADHLTSEYPERTEGRGRKVDVWKLKFKDRDNHLWDALVGCAVLASTQGIAIKGGEAAIPVKRRVSFAEMQARARAGR